MNESLGYVLQKFPDHRSRITALYNEDEDFRMLCEDYLMSAKMIEENRLNAIKEKELNNEFSQVYVDLEKEIIHLLVTDEK